MSKKFLNEKGAVKVWVIILVLVLCLAVAGGIFAFVKISGDKEDDKEETSQSSEKKNNKDEKDDTKKSSKDEDEDEDEDEDKDSKSSKSSNTKERQFTGTLDMSETAGLEGTDWTMDVYGTDEKLTKLVLTIDMEDLIKNTYETVKDVYDYDDFIELMKSTMEESVDGFEESFTSELGASNVEAEGKVNWISDEVLELTISLNGATAEELELDLDEDDSVIEAAVEELEKSMNTTFKEVK